MKIDLHIHSICSDGKSTVEDIIEEAKVKKIDLLSITDHDTIGCQQQAKDLAQKNGIRYLFGIELSVTFSHPEFDNKKAVSLDLLGYQFDINNKTLKKKLQEIRKYRKERTVRILEKINTEFEKEGLKKLTNDDLNWIQNSVDGVLGRPHIADYLVRKRIVVNRQEAFNKYLVKCNVPKYPFSLKQASNLLRKAGGIVVLAHPNDPHGTSLAKLTNSLRKQTTLIEDSMLNDIDGIECWHSRNTDVTTKHYINFAKKNGLIMTGGSDCHQNPIIMGTVKIPTSVAQQFFR